VTTEPIDKSNPDDCDSITKFDLIRNSALNGDRNTDKVRDNIVKLILAYQEGSGTDPDQVKAFEWMLKAVNMDLPIEDFYYDIALAYRDGIGTPVNLEEFRKFMEKASEVGENIEAMFQLSQAYEKGEFGAISHRDSFIWTYKMAEAGDPGAMIVVSRAYKTGKGVDKNSEKFKEWAKRAVSEAKSAEKLAEDEEAAKEAAREAEADVPAGSEQRSWVKDDLARALTQLADAEEPQNNKYDDFDFLGQASIAALKFIKDAIKKREKCSPEIVEIMVRHVKRLESEDGEVLLGKKIKYFELIEEISCAVKSADNSLLDNLSAEIKVLIYKLACAYMSGAVDGIEKDEDKYVEWLSLSEKIKSPDAIYKRAKTLEKSDPNYQRDLDEAIELGNTDAYITKSLDVCGFTANKNEDLFNLFKELVEIKNKIKKRHHLKPEDHKDGLAHYTDQDALNSMLTVNALTNHNVLRLYNIAYVNDPDEGKPLVNFEMGGGSKNPLADFFEDSGPNDPTPWKDIDFFVHIGSFSLVIDELPLWRAYGRDGNGFCVTIPDTFFLEQNGVSGRGSWESNISDKTIDIPFYKVLYGETEVKKTLEELSPILSKIHAAVSEAEHKKVAPLVRMLLSELLYLYKSDAYTSEEEVRVIQKTELSNPLLLRHDSESRSRLYTETSAIFFEAEGSKVIIGPKVADKAEAMIDIKHNLALHWWDGTCKVSNSKIRYR